MNTSDSLKRQLDKLREEKNGICLDHRTADKTDAWFAVYYASPAFSQVPGFVKRVEKLAKVDAGLHAALQPVVAKMVTLADQIKAAVETEKQAKADRKAATAQKKADKEADRANPYRRLNPVVAELLKQIVVPFRDDAYSQKMTALQNFLNSFSAKAKEMGTFNPARVYETTDCHPWALQGLVENQRLASRFVMRVNHEHRLVTMDRIHEILAEEANTYADNLQHMFIMRVGTKLSDLVERKGNLSKYEISGSFLNHWITMVFADGSQFDVQTQVIWKRSQYGVEFAQFPTCFRNVIKATGIKMELPSEAKMKKEFV